MRIDRLRNSFNVIARAGALGSATFIALPSGVARADAPALFHGHGSPRADLEPRLSTASGYGTSNCNGGKPFDVPTKKPTRVLARPNPAVIMWNSSVWPVLQNNAPLFYSDLDEAGSPYLGSLTSDYGVSTGVYRGMFTITPRTYSSGTRCSGGICSISGAEIATELKSQIANNTAGITTPEGDGFDSKGYANNLLYFVHLPPKYILTQAPSEPGGISGTVKVTNGSATITFSTPQSLAANQSVVFSAQQTAVYTIAANTTNSTTATLTTNYTGTTNTASTTSPQQCGYHTEFTDNANHHVAAVYMADISPGSLCSTQQGWTGLGPIADAFQMASHEAIEAAVNPYFTLGDNGEVGDFCQCNTNYTGFSNIGGTAAWTTMPGFWRTWLVQQPYSWSSKKCQTMALNPPSTLNGYNSSGFASPFQGTLLTDYWAPSAGTLIIAGWASGSGWSNGTVYSGGPVVANSQIAALTIPFLDSAFYIGSDGNVVATQLAILNPWKNTNLTGVGSATGASFPAPPGGGIAALAAGSGTSYGMDVYFVDNGGSLRGLGWSEGASGSGWSVFSANPLASNITPGASIAVVSRSPINSDLFWVGKDGGIAQLSVEGILSSWVASEIPGTAGTANPGSPVAVTARAWNTLDVFYMDKSGTAKWVSWSADLVAPGVTGWSVPTPTTGSSKAGGYIAAVSRSPFNLDTFFIDSSGVENVHWNNWNGPNADVWQKTTALANTEGLIFPVGGAIAGTTRLPVQLDVFDFNGTTPYTEFWSGGAWGSTNP